MDRIAVDRGVVVRRHRERRRQIGGEEPPARLPERDGFAADDDIEPLGEQRERLAGGHQRAAEGEAVVGELGHGQATSSAAGRSPQWATMKSAIAAASLRSSTGIWASSAPASVASATTSGSRG